MLLTPLSTEQVSMRIIEHRPRADESFQCAPLALTRGRITVFISDDEKFYSDKVCDISRGYPSRPRLRRRCMASSTAKFPAGLIDSCRPDCCTREPHSTAVIFIPFRSYTYCQSAIKSSAMKTTHRGRGLSRLKLGCPLLLDMI